MHKLSILDFNIDKNSGSEQDDDIILNDNTKEDRRKKVKTNTSSVDKLPEIVSPTWQNANDFFKSKTSKNNNAPQINIEGLDTDSSRIFPEGEALW